MPQSEAQARAIKKYHSKFDNVQIRVPKGEREIFSKHAASQGESLTNFLRRAAHEAIERDKAKRGDT